MLYSIVGLLVIILDQAVKYWVSNTLFGTDIVKFIPGVLSLVNVHNDGAAFSFLSGSGARIYFIIATGIFTLLVIIALATNFISGRLSRWSIVMVTAGGLANCIDRIIYGYVQDMFKVELFNFAIFNVADVFITVFAIIFVLAMIFEKPEEDPLDEEFEDDEEEEEEETPVRKPLISKLKEAKKEEASLPRNTKKGRQAEYEEKYERYKSERAVRPQQPAPRAAARTPAEASDPFAEWEKANARAEAHRSGSYAARAMGVDAPRYTAPQKTPARPAEQPAAAPRPRQQTQAQPQAPYPAQPAERPQAPARQQNAAPAARPSQPAAPKSGSMDFDLDDILNEFK